MFRAMIYQRVLHDSCLSTQSPWLRGRKLQSQVGSFSMKPLGSSLLWYAFSFGFMMFTHSPRTTIHTTILNVFCILLANYLSCSCFHVNVTAAGFLSLFLLFTSYAAVWVCTQRAAVSLLDCSLLGGNSMLCSIALTALVKSEDVL